MNDNNLEQKTDGSEKSELLRAIDELLELDSTNDSVLKSKLKKEFPNLKTSVDIFDKAVKKQLIEEILEISNLNNLGYVKLNRNGSKEEEKMLYTEIQVVFEELYKGHNDYFPFEQKNLNDFEDTQDPMFSSDNSLRQIYQNYTRNLIVLIQEAYSREDDRKTSEFWE